MTPAELRALMEERIETLGERARVVIKVPSRSRPLRSDYRLIGPPGSPKARVVGQEGGWDFVDVVAREVIRWIDRLEAQEAHQ